MPEKCIDGDSCCNQHNKLAVVAISRPEPVSDGP